MHDTSFSIETAEGVGIAYRPAGPFTRALAWLLDLAFRAIAYIGIAMVSSFLGQAGGGLILIAMFLLEWFYPVFFEMYYRGRTPGQHFLGLQVIQEDGSPIGWRASILRNLLRTADFFPVLYGTGLVAMLCNKRFQRLGDSVAGTLVVYRENAKTYVLSPEVADKAVPPPLPLSLEEQRAIVAFNDRARLLSLSRAEELADNLQVLTGKKGNEALEKLGHYAAWFTGRRL